MKINIKLSEIKPGPANFLQISLDEGEDGSPIPVLFFQPYIKDFEHHHIELNREEAIRLHVWLTEYLGDSTE
jgi:hypothetical protein